MGLDVWLYKKTGWRDLPEDDEREGEQQIELDFEKCPDHLFKVGYFRSSYNEAGFNNMMEQYGLPTLYDIFCADEQYIFAPNWEDALKRIEEGKKAVAELAETKGKYRVLRMKGLDTIKSEQEALDAFMEEIKRDGSFRTYSNRKGDFFLDGVECLGFMKGEKYGIFCYYVIVKNDAENMQWYIQAFEIMEATVRYVLAQPDKDDFYFHWSG